MNSIVRIEGKNLTNWDSFYLEFKEKFGFPDFFGRNMNGWIDCMSSLNEPDDQMTSIHCEKGKVITIQIENAAKFKETCPDQFEALVECTAFVNWRLIEVGEQPVLALSYNV